MHRSRGRTEEFLPVLKKNCQDVIALQNKGCIMRQVSEYREDSDTFETRECQLPTWLGKDAAAWNVIHSSNR